MIRPLAAHTAQDWAHAIWPAALLLVLHYVWVVRSDSSFEETAVELSLRRARALTGAGGIPVMVSGSTGPSAPLFRLAPVGWPAGAILWKNLLAVTRRRRVRSAAMALVLAGAIVTALSFQSQGTLAKIAGWLAATWGAMMVVIGPQYVRNDLRGDLLKLDLLRSYPLPGWSVVLAETLASTLVLTAIQLVLFGIAYLAFLGNQEMTPPLDERTLLIVAAVVYLPWINLLSMLIQNGAALLYPAWVRLGSGRAGGVEALGQNMLMMIAFAALLALTLALPGALAVGGFLLLKSAWGWWGSLPATVLALAMILAEAALLLKWLGRVFEKTDPAAAGIAA
jgi:hypothetical protein